MRGEMRFDRLDGRVADAGVCDPLDLVDAPGVGTSGGEHGSPWIRRRRVAAAHSGRVIGGDV